MLKGSTTLLYIIATFLVFICTIQRSKHEELFTEQETLLLPLLTILGIFLIYIAIKIINHTFLNLIILVFFVCTGYYTLISNMFYLCEFTEYEYEDLVVHEQMSSSEFTELLLENEKEIVKVKKDFNFSFLGKRFWIYLRNLYYNLTIYRITVYSLAVLIVMTYAISKNEMVEDIISVSICLHTVREVVIDSIITGYILLISLFIYDTIWVFFGDLMTEYTKGLDVPIKLVFPKYFHGFDMIGMGDIFIPALFIAIVKRYGEIKRIKMYVVAFSGYCTGVLITILGIWTFKDPKPALLFICPMMGVTCAVYCAVIGRFREFIFFTRNKNNQ